MDESLFRQAPPPAPPDPWIAVWAEHQYRQRMAWGITLGTFLLLGVALFLGVIATVGWPLFLTYCVLWGYYAHSPPCPRCGTQAYYGLLATRCVQCKLPFGTLKRDALPPEE